LFLSGDPYSSASQWGSYKLPIAQNGPGLRLLADAASRTGRLKVFYDKGRDAFYEKFVEPGAPVNPVAVK
jgi:hypothetical protein